ncbi:hypothetical protein GAMM_30004 [Gammaproteobacteria bacterium]
MSNLLRIFLFFIFIGIFDLCTANSVDDSLFLNVIWKSKKASILRSIDGKDVVPCKGSKPGGSGGVTCYEFFDSKKKIYFKQNYYITGELFDSVVASIVLRNVSDNLETDYISPEIRFAINDKKKIIGVISYELEDFQTVISPYKKCNDQKCIDEINKENPFYCDSLKEKLSRPLASLYVPLFLIGGGDTNPGNICVKPVKVCKQSTSDQLRFGTVDIDLSFKNHADSSQFKKHKEICEKFLEKTSRYRDIKADKCARNVLNFYGKNPIALKTENPLLEEDYFLETGDSGLRENRANTSIYTDFLCPDKVPCNEKKFDPYNYIKYFSTPPVESNDVIAITENLKNKVKYDKLEVLIKEVFEKISSSFDKPYSYFKKSEMNVLEIVRKRYDVLQYDINRDNECISSDSRSIPYFNDKTEIEECLDVNKDEIVYKQCCKKIEEIFDVLSDVSSCRVKNKAIAKLENSDL